MYPVPVAHAAVCGAKDKLENVPRMWEYVSNCVKGPGKYGRSLFDMFGGMSVENKSVFGCPEVQQRPDSAKGECGDQVCQEKRTLTKDTVCIVRKDGTVKQRFVANCGWGCANGENKKTSSNLSTLPKKQPKN